MARFYQVHLHVKGEGLQGVGLETRNPHPGGPSHVQDTHHLNLVGGSLATAPITPARKFRMLLHINPTRQRGKRTGSLAGASGWYMTFFAAGVIPWGSRRQAMKFRRSAAG